MGTLFYSLSLPFWKVVALFRLAECSFFSASVWVVSETSLSVLCGREYQSVGCVVVCVSGRCWETGVVMGWESAVNASPNGASPSLPFTSPPSSLVRLPPLVCRVPAQSLLSCVNDFFHFNSFPSGESFVIKK